MRMYEAFQGEQSISAKNQSASRHYEKFVTLFYLLEPECKIKV